MEQVTENTGLQVRRPGECRYFIDPGCEVALDEPAFSEKTIKVWQVRASLHPCLESHRLVPAPGWMRISLTCRVLGNLERAGISEFYQAVSHPQFLAVSWRLPLEKHDTFTYCTITSRWHITDSYRRVHTHLQTLFSRQSPHHLRNLASNASVPTTPGFHDCLSTIELTLFVINPRTGRIT